MILSEVNNHYEKTNEHKIDFNNVNVEHLIPQNPGTGWGLSVEEIKEYVNLLGNLTLVDKVINSKAGNKSLDEKIQILKESQLPITINSLKDIEGARNNWNKESIVLRHANMATLGYETIWKF